MNECKIILPGGAGLVGQNLVACLKAKGYKDIVVLDKHRSNLALLKQVQPDIILEYADLAEPGDWQRHFEGAKVVVMLQAQIGGNDYQEFVRNNVDSTRLVLEAIKINKVPHLVHISSSVVKSAANDYYTQTKKIQENMLLDSGIHCPILRPTLMFGWFDRKHLGWLSRFMKKVPVFLYLVMAAICVSLFMLGTFATLSSVVLNIKSMMAFTIFLATRRLIILTSFARSSVRPMQGY